MLLPYQMMAFCKHGVKFSSESRNLNIFCYIFVGVFYSYIYVLICLVQDIV